MSLPARSPVSYFELVLSPRFRDLPTGARFTFPGRTTVYVKRNAQGWYRDAQTGQRYRTGAGAAVTPIPEETP